MSIADTRTMRERLPVMVFGADPGFAKFGYAVVKLLRDSERIIKVGVIVTKKSDKKLKVLAADDNHQRTTVIFSELSNVLRRYRFVAATAESASWPRNASAAAKVALSWGALSSITVVEALPLAMASPQRIKKATCGTVKASKEEVQKALLKMYPGAFDAFMDEYPKTLWEHGFDAVGSIVACFGSDVIKMARRMTS